MSSFLDGIRPQILPTTKTAKLSFLNVVGNLEKIAIIDEGEGTLARNYSDLDLSDSIYTGKND